MIRTILFDLGQVLIELGSEGPVKSDWLPDDRLFSLKEWFHSPVGLAFERGELPPEMFAETLIDDLNLSVSSASVLEHFTAWPRGWFPEAINILQALSGHYQLAVLSNTNELHYPRLINEFGLQRYFVESNIFASHRIGLAKPDPECFRYVLNQLDCKPSEVLFLDDSPANISAALALGINAIEVTGPRLKQVLQELMILR